MNTSRAALAAILLTGALALADEAERPWAQGVPKDAQARALSLFKDGNGALKESLFPAAVSKYREALRAWDHPAIHYNLALALVNLDQPIEVHQHLTSALRFGAAPLDEEKHQQAQRYLALIERQLTRVTVTTKVEGATVRLDGRTLFVGPGQWEGQVRAGQHTIVCSKDGFLPDERAMVFAGGDAQTFDMRVYREAELMEYQRPFSAVIPWTVLGVGIAAAGAGLGLHLGSQGEFQRYDAQVTDCASLAPVGGCTTARRFDSTLDGANSLQTAGLAMYAVGGAAVVTSLVLFYVGRPVAYRKTVKVEAPQVTVAPLLSPSGAGAMAHIRF